MNSLSKLQLLGILGFFIAIFGIVPVAIEALGRNDLYFTLTSVGLLAIASAGVWLTFYIGRINIGQGAFALLGAYVSAILVTKFDISFCVSGCDLDWIAHFAITRCVFRDDHAGVNTGIYTHSPRVTDYQWCERNYVDSAAWSIVSVWNHIDS